MLITPEILLERKKTILLQFKTLVIYKKKISYLLRFSQKKIQPNEIKRFLNEFNLKYQNSFGKFSLSLHSTRML